MEPLPEVDVPPFCPNASCDFHASSDTWKFRRKGTYTRQAKPQVIQRYQCVHCLKGFSSQTFSVTYYLKRPDLLELLFWRLLSCSGFRQMAREHQVAPTTLMRQSNRLGRHGLLFLEQHRPREVREPLVLDGLRTFEFGQYWPFDLNLVVGDSHFIYGFSEAELRRSGTMRKAQRRKREKLEQRLGKPSRTATRDSVQELLERIIPNHSAATVHSDEHKSYPRAISRLCNPLIEHRTTSSKAARTSKNPLFPVNLAELWIRHNGSNQKRETIAFSKRRQGALYRMAVLAIWRNYLQPVSERKGGPTPAQTLGIVEERLRPRDVLGRRLFVSQIPLPGRLESYYFGRVPTRRVPNHVEHHCVRAI